MKKALWILAGLLALPMLAYFVVVVILLWSGSTLSEALFVPFYLVVMLVLEWTGHPVRM